MKRHALTLLAMLATILFVAAVLGFGRMLDGYAQSLHPVALLGATGVPRAWLFNLCGFLLPGALAAWIALALRAALPKGAGWPLRIGAQLSWMAAVAFAVQGLLPLDASDLDAPATHLHALVWTLWWIAFVPGGCLLAFGLHANEDTAKEGARTLALVSLLAAVSVVLFAASPWQWWPVGTAQRIADAAWFGWLIVCGTTVDAWRAVNPGAISSPGSSRPAGK